ncbi:hypothetical protein JCM21142_93361 [Saccharicrinis fermentans DSM 9555 = JCM 21142]|uniref:Uncharacterized protein n=1 Tax=Saccharicrinis fermentans DSM 9555 = JCM 21142 TaxID=869213 RepID=W7YQG6_9BACT|nr:hypothetical protein JCM21142_93361 [Saccharicrinis fermentans DSM 9555 = JCM 21142]
MPHYYVNKNAQDNGDHEVHKEGCIFMPENHNKIDLGVFSNCKPAINAAKSHYNQVDGCFHCCLPCHKS